jgi:CRISPR-associated endonuclease/helicase Cas3
VLWIRNTVVEAQQAFRVVASAICQDSVRIGLLHSRFPFARRAELEQNWLELLGPNRPISGPGSILVATQVVEQSVDIDLDFIVSDLAPTDMLLQRMGRLWRHSRPRRQAGQPDFWIRRPVLEEASTDEELVNALGRSARVYAPYVLLRTAAVWGAKTEINLPADIRPLLEATYAELGAQEPEAWGKLHAKLEEEKRQLVANAEAATLVLGRPMLQDDEAILTRRQGAPTTPLVLVRAITPSAKGRVVVTALDGEQMEISEQEWYRNSARFLHHWMVRAPRWMVPVDASRPAWLTLHGPDQVCIATVGNDGRCSFGTQLSNLTYDARLGLFAERATATPKPKDDDEFDY